MDPLNAASGGTMTTFDGAADTGGPLMPPLAPGFGVPGDERDLEREQVDRDDGDRAAGRSPRRSARSASRPVRSRTDRRRAADLALAAGAAREAPARPSGRPRQRAARATTAATDAASWSPAVAASRISSWSVSRPPKRRLTRRATTSRRSPSWTVSARSGRPNAMPSRTSRSGAGSAGCARRWRRGRGSRSCP